MNKNIEKKEVNTDNKSILINTFKNCLNILRDNEGLTGEKALRNLSYLLILKLIEPRLDKEINIDNYDYDFSKVDGDQNNIKIKLLKIVRFSNLAKEEECNLPTNIKCLWNVILSIHPSTKNIFLIDKNFDIERQSTYKKLIDKLNSLDLSNCDYDILGNAYEEVIQDIMTGKVFGQFFTQPLIKKLMVRLIEPKIYPDGKIDSICDPTMGTGGFLITYLKDILEQAKKNNIKPDWNYIINEGIYGKEIEPDTYQLAVSNMLISSGHMFNKLERSDSIREPITRKFDNILANPPFGIKGLKYNEIKNNIKTEYTPIKSDNAVSLFIQAIIYMLKINGKCAIVLPDGQDLFSKTNKTLIAIREYLIKTCDLKEVIYLPSGIFTYTSIKTCVLYFIKKKEGIDVLKINDKDKYEFATKILQTTKVNFYDYNPNDDTKKLLVDVPIDNIVKNSYSLNYSEYIKTEEKKYSNEITVKSLGELCFIIKGEKKRSKDGKENGLYPLYYCSILGNLYLDTYDYTDEGIIINKTNGSGKAMVYYGSNKYNVGETTIHFKSNNNKLLTKYIYYYLLHNIDLLQKYYKGANQKSIVENDLFNIKIPIPSLERQKEIVKYLDFIYEKAIKSSNDKITELKEYNEMYLKNVLLFNNNIQQKLGDLFKLNGNGKTNSKDITNTGEYPFYKASYNNPSGTHNNFDFDGENYLLIIKSGGSASNPISENYGIGKVFYVNGKCAANIAVFQLIPKTNNNFKYLYYYLKSIQDKIQKLAKYCTNNGNIDMNELMNIQIPIPSLELQQEIVTNLDSNYSLINKLEIEIENKKKYAYNFINNIGKINNTNNNNINNTDNNTENKDNNVDNNIDNNTNNNNIDNTENKDNIYNTNNTDNTDNNTDNNKETENKDNKEKKPIKKIKIKKVKNNDN